MISNIPLIGLPHVVSVQSIARSQDEFGHITAGTITYFYRKLICRISLFVENENVDVVLLQGRDLRRTFKVISKYAPKIVENITATVGNNTTAPAGDYDIFYVKHEIDHLGAWHHTRFYMEKK